jgi:hypothetical protein
MGLLGTGDVPITAPIGLFGTGDVPIATVPDDIAPADVPAAKVLRSESPARTTRTAKTNDRKYFFTWFSPSQIKLTVYLGLWRNHSERFPRSQ